MRLIVFLLLIIPAIAMADTYVAVTGDNEVETVGQVEVEKTKNVESKYTLTLDQLDARLADIDARIAEMQELRDAVAADRALVEAEAKKVTLKEKAEEP